MTLRWDIFCAVVDNYGDIGITWRLARQLVAEHGQSVRLWVDDLESFRHIRPEIDPGLDRQVFSGVEVCHWASPLAEAEPGDVVIEALACHLPDSFEQAMAARPVKPLWINLEYLSAEDWVAGCHALPSPHPRLPLTKYFFMPGYVSGTGGVVKERNLAAERARFQADPVAQAAFWHALGLAPAADDSLRISLFSYESPAIESLFAAWSAGKDQVCCLLPAGKALGHAARFFGAETLAPGDAPSRGQLSVRVIPMLDQDGYDRLLWACDCNFVRGEDSFVRAQFSGRPLVWQAYRQDEGAHWPKIEAFMDIYCAGLAGDAEAALRALWRAWNADCDAGAAWPAFWRHREAYRTHAAAWEASLADVGDLAGNLVKFCGQKMK